jgi:SAM-dependent methyltransferase
LLPIERLEASRWIPPWLRHQHESRYAWAGVYCRSGRVLDCASANAYGARQLLAAGASHVVALDIAFEAAAAARALYAEPRLTVGIADAMVLPFGSGAFDVFVSFETVEHVADDIAYVREARRVVKGGGAFICSTPNRRLTNPGTAIDRRPFNPFHIREYTLPELTRLLSNAFDRIEWFGQSFFAPVYASALNAIGSRAPMLAVRGHQMRKVMGAPFEGRQHHWPAPLRRSGEPEVLIAVCR